MSIVLVCPKCKGNAWVMLSTENKVCLDCRIPMVDAAQQMRGADGAWVCDRCGHNATSMYCSNCNLPFPPRR